MDQRESVYSTASDIISPIEEEDPSPEPRHIHEVSQSSVSPLSSQTSFHPTTGSDTSLVSPVEPSFPTDKSSRSQIPRKLAQKSPEESIKKRWNLRKEGNEETRWDEYSGEPSQAGKPPSARPGAAPEGGSEQPFPQLKERTRQILAGLKSREAVKKSAWGKVPPPVAADPLDDPPQRPPWRGASGRQAIVEPVKNTPEARTKPLMLVERHKRPARSPTPEEPAPQEEITRSPINSLSVAASHLPSVRSVASQESIKPVAPLKTRKLSQPVSPALALSPKQMEYAQLHLDSPFQSPALHPALRNTAPSPAPSTIPDYGADSPTLGSTTDSIVGPDRNSSSSGDSVETTLRPAPLQREADTGASWNTYATSTVEDDQHYPPPSPISQYQLTSSPVSIPQQWNTRDPVPIVLRKRVAANNSGQRSYDDYGGTSPYHNIYTRKSSTNILRKAVGGENSSHDRNGKPRASSLMSHMSTTKALPPTPGEMQADEAADKVGSLQARLDDLARRKRNLHKIIHELKESLIKNAIIYDARKRKEVEKMITNLHIEVQDVKNEEHDVQLKLYRVQKRKDKDDFYEKPTGLWIKRVTT